MQGRPRPGSLHSEATPGLEGVASSLLLQLGVNDHQVPGQPGARPSSDRARREAQVPQDRLSPVKPLLLGSPPGTGGVERHCSVSESTIKSSSGPLPERRVRRLEAAPVGGRRGPAFLSGRPVLVGGPPVPSTCWPRPSTHSLRALWPGGRRAVLGVAAHPVPQALEPEPAGHVARQGS